MIKTALQLTVLALFFAFLSSCGRAKDYSGPETNYTNNMLMHEARELFQPLPEIAATTVQAINAEKVQLGKVLFYDKRLSKNNTQSCNTCHTLSNFGVDGNQFSEGDLGGKGGRNSPTVYNAAFHTKQFWDGRAQHVEEQAGMPILNPVEMNIPSEAFLIDRLKQVEGYRTLFAQAFPGEANPINYKNLRLAIGAFERTLVTKSAFDKYLNGDATALTDAQKKGLREFINVGCTNCHNGKAVGGAMFQKFPAKGTEYMSFTGSTKEDLGKMEVTKDITDKYVFKVPSLLNITETAPYFHDGSVKDLDNAIRIMAKLQLEKQLNEVQVNDIKAFLGSLKGTLSPTATVAPVLP